MAKAREVLEFLRPEGGLIATGEDYEGIEFISCEPFTKKEYMDAFDKVDLAKTAKQSLDAQTKAALLERLGITEEEAKLLVG